MTGDPIGYLTFVPDGEPTLDINLGHEIDLLKFMGIKIAVITNGSLIWREDVREALMKADWVSLKIDTAQEKFWRRINRPYGTLQLSSIQQGMFEFARAYRGELVTETMLVRTVNDSEDGLSEIAGFLARLKPARAYLSIPTRPPAEEWSQPPPEEIINRANHILHERIDQVEYLIGYEGKRGVCGVRENRGGKLHSLVYGKILAEHIDPIEKKPLFHFLPGSRAFSIGTVGCNFHCKHCQNSDISQYPHEHGIAWKMENALSAGREWMDFSP